MICRRGLPIAGFFVRLCIRTKNKGLPGPFFRKSALLARVRYGMHARLYVATACENRKAVRKSCEICASWLPWWLGT